MLAAAADYDNFLKSFKDNYLGMCDGRSIWTIDSRKFDDPDKDTSVRKHIGRNPNIMNSILESKNYHSLHSRLYDGMHWLFSSKNIVIMFRRSGRHALLSRPEHAEGNAQPAKDPRGGEDHLPKTSKKRATSATAILAETSPSRGILDEIGRATRKCS